MPLRAEYNRAAELPEISPIRKRRSPPFSIRLTGEERATLLAEAKGVPLGTYVKSKVLGDSALRIRRAGIAIEDRQALGRALALLGKSGLAQNLALVADAISSGSLPVTPETEGELVQAARDVRALRHLLLLALGLKESIP